MIKLAALAAGLNIEPQPATSSAVSNIEFRRMGSLREIFLKQTECLHSTFDVGRSSVSFLIRLAAFQASGSARMKH